MKVNKPSSFHMTSYEQLIKNAGISIGLVNLFKHRRNRKKIYDYSDDGRWRIYEKCRPSWKKKSRREEPAD